MNKNRFDYIQYDQVSMDRQGVFKSLCQELEKTLTMLPEGRSKSLALTSLKEVYMWIGKAIRDDQIQRNAGTKLSEERSNS